MKLEELSRIVRDADPAVVFLTPSVLVRVVQNVTDLNWTVWRVPHSHCLLLDRPTLYKHVDQEELYPQDAHPPETVLLLERPTAEQLNGKNDELLSRYWRLLFHVSAHRELEIRLAGVSAAGLRERIEQLGSVAFEEARNVMIQDGLLLDTADDRTTYIEFASYYLELRYFNTNLLPVCFPSLPPLSEIDAMLARDVDGAALFQKTRLEGAPDPAPRTDDQSDESHDFYHRLARTARRAAAAGDTVGAAILHTRAARVAPAVLTGPAQEAARKDIHALVRRLRDTLGLSEAQAEPWRRVLPTLLDKADQGTRPVEASLLYDLQRACRENEETIYALDVAEWVLSAGHTPIKRPLESQKFVRVPNQLRNATRRLTAARLTDADRQTLANLLREALERAEGRLRDRFRPVLSDALRDAGLQPHSLPEQAALAKTVEELLDRISAAGYLSYGDVRDAIARGQMKLPDLAGPQEYIRGDPLLRLDRRLATQLDGVYRRAESYTRGLERLTAFNFGTENGRWLTRNVTLPFGVALVAGEFVWLMAFERLNKAKKAQGQPGLSFFGGWNSEWWFHLAWLTLGLMIFVTIRSAAVRHTLATVGQKLYRAARFVFWDLPARIWMNPMIRALIASVPVQFALNYGLKPALLSALLFAAFPALWGTWASLVITIVASAFVVNTRLGHAAQVALVEFMRVALDLLRSAPAVFRWVSDLFRDMVDALEWVLSRIEDWLRLRGRGGAFVVTLKAIAGILWMPFAFLVRFYTVVLLEPMLNPIKLPLSILFAKFIYPLLLLFEDVLRRDDDSLLGYSSPLVGGLSDYLSEPGAWLLVMGTLWLLPDACTFLFWEMRENWRLYRANRPAGLRAVMVGPHGETVRGLLHLGFHSGTVPRLYAKLRAAERDAARTDNWRDARMHRDALRGVEESIRRFVTRDLTAVINPCPSWGGPYLNVGRVTLGTNRIRVELTPAGSSTAAWLEWEDRSGWLVAGWAVTGFLTELPFNSIRVFENALVYLFKRAGVDIVREQLCSELASTAHHDISSDGLVVWLNSREEAPVLYDLVDPAAEFRPRNPLDFKPVPGPVFQAARLLFSRVPLTWAQWTEVWRVSQTQELPPAFGPSGWAMRILPLDVVTTPPVLTSPIESASPVSDVAPEPLPAELNHHHPTAEINGVPPAADAASATEPRIE